MQPTCFVIQPFDGSVFDKRWQDIFQPAILSAGFTPYRVDADPSASVPIEKIVDGIKDSAAIFAEITDNNPNVWLEVGLAIAYGKPLCLVCSNQRNQFPFDISHRKIEVYNTDSPSDFSALQMKIQARLTAIREGEVFSKNINELISTQRLELSDEELVCLSIVCGDPSDNIQPYELRNKMERFEFTELGAKLACRSLLKRGFIEEAEINGYNDEIVDVLRATNLAWNYVEENKNKFRIRKEPSPSRDDDIPF